MNKPRTNKIDLNDPNVLDSQELNESVERDFGAATDNHLDGFSRRRWLQLMGASLALGGAVGCRYEEEKIAPFAFRPQTRIPGVPQKFATLTELGGVAEPLLATNYDGRPIKLDGNPKHPDSMGASSTFTQAQMLDFYCPDRLRDCMGADGQEISFEDLIAAVQASDMSKVAVLAEPSASPTMMRLQQEFTGKGGNWFSFAPINDDNTRAGAKQAFGEAVRPHYHFDKCKVIVTLDADPLGFTSTGSIANNIAFAKGRDADHKKMSRLYAIESQYTTTGSCADHRLSVPSSKIAGFAAALVKALDDKVEAKKGGDYRDTVLAAMASDLNEFKGQGVIVVGEKQPAEVHALAHALNEKLGNNGKTVTYTKLPDPDRPACMDALKEFASKAGELKTLIIMGGNPVFNSPVEMKLGEVIGNIENTVHVTCFKNETTEVCKMTAAQAHPLESWKDGFSNDGSVLVGQPLINPLFGGKSAIETLAAVLGIEKSGQELVKETIGLDEAAWKKAVHDGFVEGTSGEAATVKAGEAPKLEVDNAWKEWDEISFEVVFNPSNSLYDGRFANNAWLQELPDFFTKVTWDNVASVSPKTAAALGVVQLGMSGKSKASLMNIQLDGEEITIPVVIQPGQADGSIGIETGYGRTMAGRVGGDKASSVDSVGHDVRAIRSGANWQFASASKENFVSTSSRYLLAIVQEPWEIDETGRGEIQGRMFRDYNKTESDRSSLIREGTFKSYEEFMSHHSDDHADGHARKTSKPKVTPAVADPTALPVIQPVSYRPADDDHDHDDHGHGGGHHWPEAFHMHHELFDLTPGSREEYKAENPEHKNVWGMGIDLNKCIGCNSCVVACQSENNIPVVGKEEVWRGREMHWMRIDRYYGDNLYCDAARDDDKQIAFQPVTCHHCENAPCETVCPVAATVHSHEGLNSMVYNRCIGTRYCGNNCPYKVRRFNFLNYSDAVTLLKYPGADKLPPGDLKLQSMMMNPEVTVRSRGVMEKCTYCVQRIQEVKIKAKVENREIGPNEIRTACQDACPTSAITFGDLNNKESDVAKAHANPRSYEMLEELNNRARTRFLARVRNPHPALVDHDDRDSVGDHGHGGHDEDHATNDDHKHESGDDHAHDEKGEKKDH